MADYWKVIHGLSNGAIFSDLERPLTWFSRWRHSLTLNLTNGYRYGHSYYRRRIGNRIQAFELHQFQWPWVTSEPDFKVTILFNVKQSSTNSESCMIYPIVPFPVTLSDLNLDFKVTDMPSTNYVRSWLAICLR